MTTTAIYARVSDDKLREDGERRQDVQRQVDRLRHYAGPDAQLFIDDARSAFKDDYNSRPAFVRLLREVRAHRVQRVYVESLDRWSRRVEDGLRTLKEAAEYGATVTSIAEGECDTTTPNGWFKVGVALLMAEWASRSQGFKVSQAMARKRADLSQSCPSCGVVHLGRHPIACECPRCRKKKGRGRSAVGEFVPVGPAPRG